VVGCEKPGPASLSGVAGPFHWVDQTDLRKQLVGLITKGQDLADLISHTLNPTKGGSNGNDNQLKRTRL
jgi:hypothetical protein